MQVTSAVADETSNRFTDYAVSLVVLLGQELYAIPAAETESIVTMPHCVSIPQSPYWARGVINIRDRVIPLVDGRQRLGMKSFPAEVEEMALMMHTREQDHVKWLGELEASIRERRPFALATDPHKCAFGKWYDSYKTNDMIMELFLPRFDEPHKRIHEIAQVALDKAVSGDYEGAYEIIEFTRTGNLALMRNLFSEFRTIIRSRLSREIAVIIRRNDGFLFALSTDSIESVETIDPAMIEPMPDKCASGGFLVGVAKRPGRKLAYLLDPLRMIENIVLQAPPS